MIRYIFKLNLLILLIPYILLAIFSPYQLGEDILEITKKLFGLFIYIVIFNPMLLLLFITISIVDYLVLKYSDNSVLNIIKKEILASCFLIIILFFTILPVNEYYIILSILYFIALLVRWFFLKDLKGTV